MRTRTLGFIGAGLLVAALALGLVSTAPAQTSPPDPWRSGWGPGGMMGGGYGSGTRTAQPTPLGSLQEAQAAFQGHLNRLGNSDLALDEIMQFQQNYYAVIKERSSGLGAFELLADPQTGAVFPEYGPTMMWNTKYGHMAGFGGGMMGGGADPPPGQARIGADQARQIARQWLDAYQPGSTTETPDAFPGYYTLHILQGGAITGMLSVNASGGQVWYHTWHGAFVASTEVAG